MTRGHLHSFDDEFLASLGATNTRFVESAGWGQFLEPRYQMFIATLPERAQELDSKLSAVASCSCDATSEVSIVRMIGTDRGERVRSVDLVKGLYRNVVNEYPDHLTSYLEDDPALVHALTCDLGGSPVPETMQVFSGGFWFFL